jgi:hypothetical protein
VISCGVVSCGAVYSVESVDDGYSVEFVDLNWAGSVGDNWVGSVDDNEG